MASAVDVQSRSLALGEPVSRNSGSAALTSSSCRQYRTRRPSEAFTERGRPFAGHCYGDDVLPNWMSTVTRGAQEVCANSAYFIATCVRRIQVNGKPSSRARTVTTEDMACGLRGARKSESGAAASCVSQMESRSLRKRSLVRQPLTHSDDVGLRLRAGRARCRARLYSPCLMPCASCHVSLLPVEGVA